jgi:pimeloyl-[acyl-carrier protein] methyl ester esterase
MTHLVFCHGFSYSPDYWDNLITLLPEFTIHHMDLGYYGDLKIPEIKEPVIGIGHSLGLIKLMQQNFHFKTLIGLNSFVNFLGNEPHIHKRRAIELDTFEILIRTSPNLALKSFHHRCGVTFNLRDPNKDRLLTDLNLLRDSFPVPDRLTLIATQDDIVCPPDIIQDNFGSEMITMLDSGSHGLGYNHAAEVASIIKRKNNDLDNTGCTISL